jgi:hypothetical protein
MAATTLELVGHFLMLVGELLVILGKSTSG